MSQIVNKIQRGFSRSAYQYDRFAGLHRDIADKFLLKAIEGVSLSTILDVGCGTGYLTAMLKAQYPRSKITGLDFAPGMLEIARGKHEGIEWVLGDSRALPFVDESFDLLVSNLAYQWADDLARVFNEARRVLRAKGSLACTLFGFNTCQELFQSLNEAKNKPLDFKRLPDANQVREALNASGFSQAQIIDEQMKVEFADMQELIMWLKSIGANNLSGDAYLGVEAFTKAAAIYREKFSYLNGVVATFEVIGVYAKV